MFRGREVIFKEAFCFLKSVSQRLKMHYHAQVHQYLIFFFKKKSSLGLTLQKEKKAFMPRGEDISSNVVGFADVCVSTVRARRGYLDD